MYELKTAEKNVKCIDALISETTMETFANLVKQYCDYVPVEKFLINQKPLDPAIITPDYDGIICVEDEGASNTNCYNFVLMKKRDGILHHMILFFGIVDISDTETREEFGKRETLQQALYQIDPHEGMEVYLTVNNYNDSLTRFETAFFYFIHFFVKQEYERTTLAQLQPLSDILERYRAEYMTKISALRIQRENRLKNKKKADSHSLEKKWRLKKKHCIFCRCRCKTETYDICDVCTEKVIGLFKKKPEITSAPDFSLCDYDTLLKEKKNPYDIQCTFCGSKKFQITHVNLRARMCAKCDAVWRMLKLGYPSLEEKTGLACGATMASTLQFVQEVLKKLITVNGFDLPKALAYLSALRAEDFAEFGKEFGMQYNHDAISKTATALVVLFRLKDSWENGTLKRNEFRPNQNDIFTRLKRIMAEKSYNFACCFSVNERRRAEEMWSLLGLQFHLIKLDM